MPTLQRLADNGLIYSQWHTAALCSPSRSCLLNGRNHHVNRFASITEGSDGFPGAAARLPAQCATIGQVLQDNGYSTFWVGKNHNVPEEDISGGGSKSEWPLQKGFDRFYGFFGGETNQWYPDLAGQPAHRAALPPGAGLSRVERPDPSGDPDAARSAVVQTVQALVNVVLPRRQPRAGSRRHRVRRPSTRASSTTAMRRIGSGCCPA